MMEQDGVLIPIAVPMAVMANRLHPRVVNLREYK